MSKLKRFFDEGKLLVLWGIGAVAALSLVIASAVQPENAVNETKPQDLVNETQVQEATNEAQSQDPTEESQVQDATDAALPQDSVDETKPQDEQSEPVSGDSTVSVQIQTEVPTQADGVEFPLYLENDRLMIENVFAYDGMNPDCEYQEGKSVAAIMVTNRSAGYLEQAEITLQQADGTKVKFVVQELPADKAVMAFAVDNASATESTIWKNADCTASWLGEEKLPDGIEIKVDGMLVMVTNNTGRDLSKLNVYCRSPLGEEYFGGVAYKYTVKKLNAGESATIEALDCLLGLAEVVRVTMK